MKETEAERSFSSFLFPLTDRKAIRLIFIVGLMVYFYIFFNGFVWDDITYITQNPELHTFNLITLIGPNSFNSSGYFRPLPAVYFSLIYHIFGRQAFFYHALQLLLHIGCTVLLYRIFRHFFDPGLSLVLGLIFLVHPINVESVAYIGSSQSQLYFLFGGLAFFWTLGGIKSLSRAILVHLMLLAALFTKEVSVLFFALIYLYLLLHHHKIPKSMPVLTALSCLVYILVRIKVLGTFLHHMQLIPISRIPLTGRLLHVPLLFSYYLRTLLFPRILAIDQIWTISFPGFANFYLPLFFDLTFFAALIWLFFRLRRYRRTAVREFFLFAFWYLGGMAFLMQVFPLDMTVADRWFYLPFVGLLGLVGLVWNSLPSSFKTVNAKRVISLFVLAITLFSLRTIVRTTDWHDPVTLYSRDVRHFDNYDIENNLGVELIYAGRPAEALPHILKSVSLLPHDTNLFDTGSVYEILGDKNQAKSYYRQALEIRTDFPGHDQVRQLAAEGLAKISIFTDPPEEIGEFLQQAVIDYPDSGTLWACLAINRYHLSRQAEALAAADRARRLLPNPTTEKLFGLIRSGRQIDLRLN